MSGIANHKNSYSTGVKVGNWVEDTIGGELASGARSSSFSTGIGQSEARAKFQDFSKHPEYKYDNTPVTSRDSGTTYEQMFGHRGADPSAERFKTTNQIMNSAGAKSSSRGNVKMRERARALEKSRKANHFTTHNNATQVSSRQVSARAARSGSKSPQKKPQPPAAADSLW